MEELGVSITQVNTLRRGDLVLHNKRPCKISDDITKSKTGKHGSAKAHIQVTDIFTDQKSIFIMSTSDNMEIPLVKKGLYQVIDLTDDNFLSLLDDKNETKNDVKLVDINKEKEVNLKNKITSLLQQSNVTILVNIIEYGNETRVIDCKIE